MKKRGLVLLLIIMLGGGLFTYLKYKKDTNATPQASKEKKRIQEPVNIIAIDQRPYLQISPLADGKNITLSVLQLKKPATDVEYELEYQAGSLLQGAFGKLSLASVPTAEKILLGSCSAGGACTYHEDVKGGSLLTRFDGPEPYALKSRWKYIINSNKEKIHSSYDAKFQIKADSLAKHLYLIIFNTAGYPDGLDSSPMAELYSLSSAEKLTGMATISIRADEEGELIIVGYDGSSWQKFKTTVDEKTATADVKLMELYTVIKK